MAHFALVSFVLLVGSTCAFSFVGLVLSRSVLSAAMGLGAWRIPPFCLQPRVNESFCLFPQFSVDGVSHFGPPPWSWVSGLLTLL